MINRRQFLQSLALSGLVSAFPSASRAAQVMPTGRIIPADRSKILSHAADTPIEQIPNFRRLMREIVIELGHTSRKRNMPLLVRNAPELLIKGETEGFWEEQREPGQDHVPLGGLFEDYRDAIDGMIIDGLYWGYDRYDAQTGKGRMSDLFHKAAESLRQAGRPVFSIDYAKDQKAAAAIAKAAGAEKVVSYLDQEGSMDLASVPHGRPDRENPEHVSRLADAHNWLPCFQGDKFPTRRAWLDALQATSYDLLVLDPFWRGESFARDQVKALKTKPFGSSRLVFARLPVGFASPGRWYWQKDWAANPPAFLKQPLPEDPDLWLVEYWSDEWKAILSKYYTGLADLGFDGFLIDAADAFIPLEELYPVD